MKWRQGGQTAAWPSASGSHDRRLRIWDMQKGALVCLLVLFFGANYEFSLVRERSSMRIHFHMYVCVVIFFKTHPERTCCAQCNIVTKRNVALGGSENENMAKHTAVNCSSPWCRRPPLPNKRQGKPCGSWRDTRGS